MQEKYIFREMLSEIKGVADSRGNVLTVEEVQEFFGNAHLEQEQLELICEYLISQKIKVEGYKSEISRARVIQPEEEEKKTEKPAEGQKLRDDHFLQLYLEDLEDVQPADEEEELELFRRACDGDELARGRLVELHLRTVYELSMTYCEMELAQSDLIQEGNVALLLGVNQLPSVSTLMEFREYLYREIREAMEAALEDCRDQKDLDEEIAERANHLQEAVKNLEEDLEHKVSVEELSAYLEMPIEEIRDILRMAGEGIEIGVKKEKEER